MAFAPGYDAFGAQFQNAATAPNWFNQAFGGGAGGGANLGGGFGGAGIGGQGAVGDLSGALFGNQLGALGTMGNLGNAVDQSMGSVNAANQQAAMGNEAIMGQLANSQMNQGGAFAREMAALPILANMSNRMGVGGGMTGFQSTNSPQAASLPGGTTGALGSSSSSAGAASLLNPNTYIGSTMGQLAGNAGGPNALGFLGYQPGSYQAIPGSGGTAQRYIPGSSNTLAQLMAGTGYVPSMSMYTNAPSGSGGPAYGGNWKPANF